MLMRQTDAQPVERVRVIVVNGGEALEMGNLGVLEARERGFVADQGARRRKRQQVLIITVHEESARASTRNLRM